MLDPVSAIALATSAYKGIKKSYLLDVWAFGLERNCQDRGRTTKAAKGSGVRTSGVYRQFN